MKRVLLAYSIVLILVITGTAIYLHNKPDQHSPKLTGQTSLGVAHHAPITQDSLLEAVNAERAKYGAKPLTLDQRLINSAQAKANDEVNSNYFAHVSPAGVRGIDIAHTAMGGAPGNYDENIEQDVNADTQNVVGRWIGSPVHHNAMVNPKYTLTGFGISGYEYVEHFYGPF